MDLHRQSGTPDWEAVPDKNRNGWQKLAASTNGLVTPSNLISLIGLFIVLFGVWELWFAHYWPGLIGLAVGRAMDIADGMAAQSTETKSPLGEAVDATIDKIGTLLTLIVLYVKAIAPHWAIIALVVPQILATAVVAYSRPKGIKLHPSLQAKLGMATAWVSLLGFMLITALGKHVHSKLLLPFYILTLISVALSLYATADYAKLVKSARP